MTKPNQYTISCKICNFTVHIAFFYLKLHCTYKTFFTNFKLIITFKPYYNF